MYNTSTREIMHKTLLSLALITSVHAGAPNHIFEFGAKTTSYDYTERDSQDNVLNTEESNFFEIGGIYASYDYKLKELTYPDGNVAHYLNIYGSYSGGDTDYTGSSLVNGEGFGSVKNTTGNTFYELEINLKRVRYHKTSSTYILFGLGYKEWERELSSTQVETYHYKYAQIGVGGEKQIYKNISLGIDIKAIVGFDTKMDADFDETTQTNSLNETFNLGAVYSYKIATPLTIPINKQLSFTTKAEYEFSSYGKSDTITKTNFFKPGYAQGNSTDAQLYEPDSQQKNWNLYAGLKLIF